jgi:MoCo/4Fe-4S cofactor protein with predicted Tat translocation signal
MTAVPPTSDPRNVPLLPVREHPARGYWRSLDELAAAPAFRDLVEREFPSQLAVWDDPVGRRRFLQLMAASLALAGVGGCASQPPEAIVPFVRGPEDVVPGRPLYYATALTRGGYALGVLAESHEGRPTKLEGNPQHPACRHPELATNYGATDASTQASILDLYDPDRSQTVLYRGGIETWDRFLTEMHAEMARLRERQGAGLRILTETVTSPTLAGQFAALLEELPEARWHQYEPVNLDNVREGARLAFGQHVAPLYHFERAGVVISLDSDFLTNLPGSVRYAGDFAARRRPDDPDAPMSRLYVIESTPTITGAMADHRQPLAPQDVETVAQQIAERLGVNVPTPDSQSPTRNSLLPDDWLSALVGDLAANRGAAIVLAGIGQPPAVHAICHAINQQLGNVGDDRPIEYVEPAEARPENQLQSLRELVSDMHTGEVETLVILGGNPVFSAPGELNFAAAMDRVNLRVNLSLYNDETSFLCHWHIPAAHELEAWSDARAFDGTATILQPLIAPLYGGRTAHELVSVLAGQPGRTSYEIVQEHWQRAMEGDDFGQRWRRALHDGLVPESSSLPIQVEAQLTAEALEASRQQPSTDSDNAIVVEFRPDPTLWDGRHANNGWLQELPKPLTKITWDNVALVSGMTAQQLNVTNGDVLEIRRGEASIHAPAWIMPGQPDDCVSLTFGYGRTRSGRVGNNIGYNAYGIRPAQAPWFTQATVRKTGERMQIATTQTHHSMEGRDIIRVTTEARYHDDPQHLVDAKHAVESLPSLYPEFPYEGNAWGMVVNQSACIGCNACVVACQAENNIPIVGKEQVLVGREMHWLRIDRYWHAANDKSLERSESLVNPETYFQPMMCVHCEKAPCEPVCPVHATVHDSEGTSNMIYNRCVGTRYCSNNCPYKVRRFNYLQYTDTQTPSLKLQRNPDVTVRNRGVMEKCSYCIQRVSAARIEAKRDNRAIRDGEVLTACQQVCPTRAIVFGNLNDTEAEVSALKQSPLNYGVLAELNTQPRTTYLARVANPHPDLPPPTATLVHPGPEGTPPKDRPHQ